MSQNIVHRDLDLSSVIKAVCIRPKMYVASDENFRMIAAFIDGFAHAGEAFSNEIREFSFWLGFKLKLPRNFAWFCNLEKVYPDYKDALEKLPELFEEFRNDKKAGWQYEFEFAREMKRFREEAIKH